MNIAIVANYATNFKGNFMASLFNLENRLKASPEGGTIVYVFYENAREYEWVKEMIENGKHVYFLKDKIISDIQQIGKIIAAHQIDIIHTHFVSPAEKWLVFAKIKGVKTVFHLHNSIVWDPKSTNALRRIIQSVHGRMKLISYKITQLWMDCYCGCGESVYDGMITVLNKHKCTYVENKIYFPRFDSPCGKGRIEMGFQGKKVYTIFANHFYRKGCDLAIDALKDLPHNNLVLLLITGNSEFATAEVKKHLKTNEIPEWIKIVPTREDIQYYYRICDAFLTPSREEGLAYAIPEAIYCGTIPVRSNLPSMDWKLPFDFVCRFENVLELREKIKEIASFTESERKKIIDTNKKFVVDHFSVEKWSEEIVLLYRKILSPKSSF